MTPEDILTELDKHHLEPSACERGRFTFEGPAAVALASELRTLRRKTSRLEEHLAGVVARSVPAEMRTRVRLVAGKLRRSRAAVKGRLDWLAKRIDEERARGRDGAPFLRELYGLGFAYDVLFALLQVADLERTEHPGEGDGITVINAWARLVRAGAECYVIDRLGWLACAYVTRGTGEHWSRSFVLASQHVSDPSTRLSLFELSETEQQTFARLVIEEATTKLEEVAPGEWRRSEGA